MHFYFIEIQRKYINILEPFPYGEAVDKYWKDFIDGLMAEVQFYDFEVELHTKYRPKEITSLKEAFAFMDNIVQKK